MSKRELNTRILKKIKVFLVRVAKIKQVSEIDILEIRYTIVILKDRDIEVNIPISKSYKSVINNLVYRLK